jgi:hypothetical protein
MLIPVAINTTSKTMATMIPERELKRPKPTCGDPLNKTSILLYTLKSSTQWLNTNNPTTALTRKFRKKVSSNQENRQRRLRDDRFGHQS